MHIDQEYAVAMLQPICKFPVLVTRVVDERGVLLTVHANKQDMGLVIGKSGQNIAAVRQLLRQFGVLHSEKIAIRVEEPQETFDELEKEISAILS